MQLLTVYTREDFIYDEDLRLSLIQDKLSENKCHLECKRNGYILFENHFDSSIYRMSDVLPIAETQLKSFGVAPKLQYSVKKFTYLLHPSKPFYSVEFVVSGDRNVCAVTYSINNSHHNKSTYFACNYYDILMVRNCIDSLFQLVYQWRNVKVKDKK